MNSNYITAEINRTAIKKNIKALKKKLKAETKFMAVVKSDAYGHGIIEIAEIAVNNGADYLGVARVDEAMELRKEGISLPILVFGYTADSDVEKLIKYDIIQTVYSLEYAQRLSSAVDRSGGRIDIHIKIDTGMGRLGFMTDDLPGMVNKYGIVDDIRGVLKLKNLKLNGFYSHFASSDTSDKSHADLQLKRFKSFLQEMKNHGIEAEINHIANSAAIIEMPESHLNMVRAGISMYGLYPSPDVDRTKIHLTPAMEIKSHIAMVKNVGCGYQVSYGSTYITEKPTIIASIPVGYGDGYSRNHSSRGYMIVKGKQAPVVGRVCMDQTMLDLGEYSDAKPGDEVVIMGCQGKESISADDLADHLNTINYEIVTSITRRVPRIYIDI